MARLTQIGFELNSTTAGVEFDSITGAPTIVTSTVRSGTYAMQANVSATTAFLTHQYAGTGNTNNTYVRAYINFASFPTANNISILLIRSAAAGNNLIIHADTNGALSVTNEQAASVQVGNKSSGLKLNTWYRVELAYTYATGAVRAYIGLNDGPPQLFAQGTANASIDTNTLRIGLIDSATANMFIDDIAINDNTGTSQTDIPGPGKIIHLKPSAAGDVNGFTVAVGGTAGSANNFSRVQENTPDDATSYNGAALLNAEDLFNVDNFTGGAFSSINVVAVGIRMADLVAGDATTGVKLEIEKTASGTKSQSGNLIPNSTSFLTNTAAAPRNYSLVTYNDPDGVPWGQNTLDSMQIGYINDTVGVQTVAISTVWASVDFTPVLYGTSTSTSSTSISSTSSSTSSTSVSTSSTSISSTSQSTSTSSTSTSISSTSSSTSSTSSSISSTSTSSTSSSTSISSTSSSISSTSVSSTSTSSTSSSTSISSTSTSFSSTSSSISSTSASTSSTSFSSTSSSSSTSTTTVPPGLTYSYQDMVQSGPLSGSVAISVVIGGITWINPSNALTNDGLFATDGSASGLNTGNRLQLSGFGFAIPAANTISGILVEIDMQSSGTNTQASKVQLLKAGVLSGTDKGSVTPIPTSLGYVSYGGSSDLWGNTLTPADINSPYFGIALEVNPIINATWQASVDHIRITVYTNPTSLLATSSNLTNVFSNANYSQVNGDDGDYFIEYGSEYMIRQYKRKNSNNTDTPSMTWRGRTTESTLISPMLIQIYNVNSATWETLAVANTVPPDTDFSVTVKQTSNVSNYYDSNNIVTFRSYQQVI